MRGFPPTVDLDLGDGVTALCFHGSPSSNDGGDLLRHPRRDARADPRRRRAPVLLCGHTHLQMLRRLEHALVVNPGAIGLPFSAWAPHTIAIAPWAEYGILTPRRGPAPRRPEADDLRRRRAAAAEPRERHAARGVVGRLLAARRRREAGRRPQGSGATLGAIRELCLGLPETSERLSHGAPSFFVKRQALVRDGADRPSRRRPVRDLVRGRRRRPGDARSRPIRSGSSGRRTSGIAAGSASGSTAGWTGRARGHPEDAYAEVAPAKLVEAARAAGEER